MVVTITLSPRETGILAYIAQKNGLSTEAYAANVLRNFITAQIRGYYQQKINAATIVELVALYGEPTDF